MPTPLSADPKRSSADGQAVRPPPVLLLGGPGWDAERGRPGVTVCADLESAVGAVVALVSGRVPAR